jgi:alpha-glucosidase
VSAPWWRDAVVYQTYLRSFCDADGDGVGDLRGVLARLDHLVDLGVDALWLNPFYVSGDADAGYDVIDHRAVDPVAGTLDDVDALLAAAHERGLRVVGDVVANHTSVHHPWFVEAVLGGPGHPARRRYHVAPGRDGGPPSDWRSVFGGPAWEPLGRHPDVVADVERTVRFWLDRGFDGLRFDAAGSLAKAEGYPPVPPGPRRPDDDHPYSDRPEVHEVYRRWAQVLAERPERYGVVEAWGPAWVGEQYLRPDELQQAFAIEPLFCSLEATELRDQLQQHLDAASRQDRRPAWVHGNHDVTRAATRWGLHGSLAVLLALLALPGATYLYAGDELGLSQVDLPDHALRDPTWVRSGGTDRGRDGARVPLPWTTGPAAAHGFSRSGSPEPWLPQPAGWGARSVQVQRDDPGSPLSTVRAALRARSAFRTAGEVVWLDAPDGLLAFVRDDLVCVTATSGEPLQLDRWGATVVATSRPTTADGTLPAPGTAWLRRG